MNQRHQHSREPIADNDDGGDSSTSHQKDHEPREDKWHGKADGINADTVRAVVEHHYFQRLVQDAVEARTQAYLSKWWKRVTVTASAVLLVLGALGVKEYTSFGDKIKEATERGEKAKDLVEQATTLVNSARGDVANANGLISAGQKYVDSSQRMSDKVGDMAQQSSVIASSLLGSLGTRQEELKQEQEKLTEMLGSSTTQFDALKAKVDSVNKLKGEIIEIQNQINGQKKQVDENLGKVDGERETVAQTIKEVAKTLKEVKGKADGLKKDLDFQKELTKAESSEIVVLRSGPKYATEIQLPDFRASNTDQPKVFDLKLVARRIKNDIDIDVTVDKGPRPLSFRDLEKNQSGEISGTPYMFRVEAIYHAKLAFDFVVIKVLPSAGATIAGSGTATDSGLRSRRD